MASFSNEVSEKAIRWEVRVEFSVPFPKYAFDLDTQTEERLRTLEKKWATPTVFFPMEDLTSFKASSKLFIVTWVYTKNLAETHAAKQDMRDLGNETALLVTTDEQNARSQKCSLPVAALALAGIGVFALENLMGSQCNGLKGFFESRQDTGRQTAENIGTLQQLASALTYCVMEVSHEHNENFFLVKSELKSIRKI